MARHPSRTPHDAKQLGNVLVRFLHRPLIVLATLHHASDVGDVAVQQGELFREPFHQQVARLKTLLGGRRVVNKLILHHFELSV